MSVNPLGEGRARVLVPGAVEAVIVGYVADRERREENVALFRGSNAVFLGKDGRLSFTIRFEHPHASEGSRRWHSPVPSTPRCDCR